MEENNVKNVLEDMGKAWNEYSNKIVEEGLHTFNALFNMQMEILKQGLSKNESYKVEDIYKEWQEAATKNSEKMKTVLESVWSEEKKLYERSWEMIKNVYNTTEGGNELLKEHIRSWSNYMERIKDMYHIGDYSSFEEIYKKDFSMAIDNYTKVMSEFVKSPVFVSMLGKQLDFSLNYKNRVEEMMTEIWHGYGIPTRSDFDVLSKRVYEISHRIDGIEDKKEGAPKTDETNDRSK